MPKSRTSPVNLYNEVLAAAIAGSLAFCLGRAMTWIVLAVPVGWFTYRLAEIPPPPGYFSVGFILRNAFDIYDWGTWLGYVKLGVFWGVILYLLRFRLAEQKKGTLIAALLLYGLFLYGMIEGYWFVFVEHPPRPEKAATILAWSQWFYAVVQSAGTVLFLWLLVPYSQRLLRRWFG